MIYGQLPSAILGLPVALIKMSLAELSLTQIVNEPLLLEEPFGL
jgi:hypothetical protein